MKRLGKLVFLLTGIILLGWAIQKVDLGAVTTFLLQMGWGVSAVVLAFGLVGCCFLEFAFKPGDVHSSFGVYGSSRSDEVPLLQKTTTPILKSSGFGGLVLIFVALGLGADLGLAVAFVRRLRELIWVGLGLLMGWAMAFKPSATDRVNLELPSSY